MNLTPYLSFKGDCAEALKFYERCFNGRVINQSTFRNSPMAANTSPEMQDQILHISMQVGDSYLMGSDIPEEHYQKPAPTCQIAIGIKDPAEAEKVFNALSEGSTIHMPLQETFWAQKFGMLTDRYGFGWMISCDKPMGGQPQA